MRRSFFHGNAGGVGGGCARRLSQVLPSSSQTQRRGSRGLPGTAPGTVSRPRTVDLDDVFGYIDKLVDQALSVHLGEDAALVVVPAGNQGARSGHEEHRTTQEDLGENMWKGRAETGRFNCRKSLPPQSRPFQLMSHQEMKRGLRIVCTLHEVVLTTHRYDTSFSWEMRVFIKVTCPKFACGYLH